MRKKEVLKLIAIMVIVAIVGTFIINEAYKIGCGYVTMWKASDMLIFFGTFLGGLSTLFAVYVTIKDGDKKRRKDRLESINRERYKFLSQLLYESLRNFDGSYLLDFKKNVNENRESLFCEMNLEKQNVSELLPPQKLSELIEIANMNKNLEIHFPSDEEAIFHDTLTKFREYGKEYISLLDSFKHKGVLNMGFITDDYLDKIESLCSVKYNELVTSVHNSLKNFEQRWG